MIKHALFPYCDEAAAANQGALHKKIRYRWLFGSENRVRTKTIRKLRPPRQNSSSLVFPVTFNDNILQPHFGWTLFYDRNPYLGTLIYER